MGLAIVVEVDQGKRSTVPHLHPCSHEARIARVEQGADDHNPVVLVVAVGSLVGMLSREPESVGRDGARMK